MPRITLTFTLLVLIKLPILAQLYFERSFDVPVTKSDIDLKRAWQGGLNYPIFSNVDLDNNGETDLIAFEKSGNRLVIFKNNSLEFEALNINHNFQYGYDQNWILFKDFNCDGYADILAGETSSIRFYTNNGDFTFKEGELLSSDLGGFDDNIFVANSDIPSIEDIDGDGDLDILTFEIGGTHLEWHKNTSIEETGKCGLTFKKQSGCWGRFEENALTSEIITGTSCSDYGGDIIRGGSRHAGSTVTAFDQNKDGDFELLIGDISTSSLTYLNNGGSSTFSNVNVVMENFPNYDNPLSIYQFPFAAYVDANQDEKEDLIIVSNEVNIGDNKSIWHYKNIGIEKDTFTFQTDEFLVGEMLDFGTSAFPIFIDENQDGLLDILVGSKGTNMDSEITGSLTLLRNVGTEFNPAFKVENEDYLDLSLSGETYFYPAIGDIDKDGDEDLLIGLQNGEIIYMNNLAGPGNPCDFVNAGGDFEGIDVGSAAAPVLCDLNKDGNLDLIVGHSNGSLSYFENQTNTGFDYSVELENLGNVSTKDLVGGYFFGFSTPFFYESKGEINLLVGSESGKVHHYSNISDNLEGSFNLLEEDYHNLWDGGYSKPLLGDLNNDGLPELIVGNAAGGLAYYNGLISHSVAKPITVSDLEYTLVGNKLKILNSQVMSIELFDINGRLINSVESTAIVVPSTRGVYIIKAEIDEKFASFAIIK